MFYGRPGERIIGYDNMAALIELGLVERCDGKLRVPFDVIHTEFTLARVA